MSRVESDAPRRWPRWASALASVAVLLVLGSLVLSYVVETKVTDAIEEIRVGVKKSPSRTIEAPSGSKLVWQGDSVGAVLAIIRSPSSRDSDTLALIGTLDSAMASVRGLAGFVSEPVLETRKVMVDLRATADTAEFHRVGTLWPGQFPRPIRIFQIAPDTRSHKTRTSSEVRLRTLEPTTAGATDDPRQVDPSHALVP